MTSAPEVEANLAMARGLLERARAEGATLAALPENFAIMGRKEIDKIAAAEIAGEGPIQAFLGHCARELGLWIIGGTIPLRVENEPKRVASASLMFDDQGRCVGRYDKIHLFDVGIPNRDAPQRKVASTPMSGRPGETRSSWIPGARSLLASPTPDPALQWRKSTALSNKNSANDFRSCRTGDLQSRLHSPIDHEEKPRA